MSTGVNYRIQIENARVPKQAIAVLANSTPVKLSLWLRDSKLVRKEEAEAFEKAVADACKWAAALGPQLPEGLAIDWKNTAGVRALFTKLIEQGAEHVVTTTEA
jgi:hypothetical protein